ncbi:JmjC domain [Trypanosoma vivax]|nr:hypothetical protein TRVL_05185 [Trypanosoma vivax]KAH8619141.1 JmjC domain [Trypanosoma vivax]
MVLEFYGLPSFKLFLFPICHCYQWPLLGFDLPPFRCVLLWAHLSGEIRGFTSARHEMLELDGKTLTLEQFRECCLRKNTPAIIRNAVPNHETTSGTLEHQSALLSLEHLLSRLVPTALVETFGPNHLVPTTECPTPSGGGRQELCMLRTLADVVELWRRGENGLYIKDWHMQADKERLLLQLDDQQMPLETVCLGSGGRSTLPCKAGRSNALHGGDLYRVPCYLGQDWMDEFCRSFEAGHGCCSSFGEAGSDYRFAYIGPPSSWTPLHFDVFGTYSWSLNVCGEKLWFFPTPDGNERLLEGGLRGLALVPDIRTSTWAELWTVTQFPGDIVFVPSCYLHQVHNIDGPRATLPIIVREVPEAQSIHEVGDDCARGAVPLVISVNHNWCNEWCVEKMVGAFCRDASRLAFLVEEGDRVALFGEDTRLWHDHVESMLLNGTNWNFASLRNFLRFRLRFYDNQDEAEAGDASVRSLIEECLGRLDALEEQVIYRSGR